MKKRIRILMLIAVFALFLIWVFWANTAVEITEYTLSGDEIPASFDGFRILQISDLHNATFGENNGKLLQLMAEAAPDIIVITGDLVDSRNTDIDIGIRFAEAAARIAPTYYVSGNHEARIREYGALKAGLEAAGVVLLENEQLSLECAGEKITLLGVDDPSFRAAYLQGGEAAIVASELDKLKQDGYTVLLSHRPELFQIYTEYGMDLVFTGHAHGGQFRLPFVGGLVAPGQGFFPEYDAGLFTQQDTTMVVSRGLGNSIIPLRFNNRPEIVIVTLKST